MKTVATQRCTLIASPRLHRVVWLMHGVALAAIVWANLPPGVRACLLVAVVLSLWRSRHCYRRSEPIRLRLYRDGRLEKLGADETVTPLQLDAQTLVVAKAVVLRYRCENRLHTHVVLSDCMQTEDFRQLRLWLRNCKLQDSF